MAPGTAECQKSPNPAPFVTDGGTSYHEDVTGWWFLLPLSYLVGTVPTANIVAGWLGLDPTKEGSGNPGASNVYRLAGRRAGIAVLVVDVMKGLLPALAGLIADGHPLGVACGVAAMLGHVFPVGRITHGGKGVATLGGATCALYPLVALALIAIWAVVTPVAKKASIGSLVMAALLPIALLIADRETWEVLVMGASAALVIFRHRSNIIRLLTRTEHALGR